MDKKMEILARLTSAVLERDPQLTELTAKEALENGIDPLEAIDNGLIRAITVVGEKYETGEFFLPDLVMGGQAFKAGIKVLEPELLKRKTQRKSLGTIILGTVAGDIHSLGKDIVATLFSAAGFEVRDIGVDVPVKKFIEGVRSLRPDALGMSALMSTTIGVQRDVIEALKVQGLRGNVKVLIGGAATSDLWRKEIGADGWTGTAVEAVKKAKELLGVE